METVNPILAIFHPGFHNIFPLHHQALAQVVHVATANRLRSGHASRQTWSGPPATTPGRRHRPAQSVASVPLDLATTRTSTISPRLTITPPSLSLAVVQLVALVVAQMVVWDTVLLHVPDPHHAISHTRCRREKDRLGRT